MRIAVYELVNLEATIGFEPMNKSFADFPLKPLGYVAMILFHKYLKLAVLGEKSLK